MHATDIIGYTLDGEVYCPDCLPEAGPMDEYPAMFAGCETDSPMHCADCGYLIEGQVLTTDGDRYVAGKIAGYLIHGEGRAEILAAWWDEFFGNDQELLAELLVRFYPGAVVSWWLNGESLDALRQELDHDALSTGR